jgi:hypothetical protein
VMNFTEGANMEMHVGVSAGREQARQPAAKETTIAELARKALRESGGDTESAVEALADELLSDAVLLRALIRPAVMDAVIYRVEHSMRLPAREWAQAPRCNTRSGARSSRAIRSHRQGRRPQGALAQASR